MVTPELLSKNGTEDGHQAALFCWASSAETQQRYPQLRQLLFAIPNGGERNIKVAAKLKATGTKAGVPDVFLSVPRGAFHGLYVELKKIGGRGPTTEQLSFIAEAKAFGYAAVVVHGWEAARDAIVSYLSL